MKNGLQSNRNRSDPKQHSGSFKSIPSNLNKQVAFKEVDDDEDREQAANATRNSNLGQHHSFGKQTPQESDMTQGNQS